LNLDMTTGQLVKNLDQSNLFSQKFRPVLVKKVDSLKRNTGNPIREEPDEPLPQGMDCLTPVPEKENRRAAPAVPADLQPIVARVIARLNELAGTAYKPDSKIVINGLVQRLKSGASEADCLTVVEDRWHRWHADQRMRQHFNPDTLFREDNFEKYKNAALMRGNSTDDRLHGSGGFVG
jgi:uncharacterized phage protein (TIGR02220 family)